MPYHSLFPFSKTLRSFLYSNYRPQPLLLNADSALVAQRRPENDPVPRYSPVCKTQTVTKFRDPEVTKFRDPEVMKKYNFTLKITMKSKIKFKHASYWAESRNEQANMEETPPILRFNKIPWATEDFASHIEPRNVSRNLAAHRFTQAFQWLTSMPAELEWYINPIVQF